MHDPKVRAVSGQVRLNDCAFYINFLWHSEVLSWSNTTKLISA